MPKLTLEIDTKNLNSTALLLDGEKLGYLCSVSIEITPGLTEVRLTQLHEIPGMGEDRITNIKNQREKLRKLFPVVTLDEV
jgi:hypothetical protein